MDFHVMTLFPDMITNAAGESILGRAAKQDLVHVHAVNIRDFTDDKHNRVDDYPYGGGAGMLMQAQPVHDAIASVKERIGHPVRVVFLTPQGEVFSQQKAESLAKEEDLILLCGHYEGIDERVLEEDVTDYLSIGDYVLTGGELPALVLIDAISRLVPGVLHNQDSADTDSFGNGLLEYPQYTRPVEWHEKKVPDILLSGDHAKVDAWRLKQSLERTKAMRPDLYEKYMEEHPPVVKKKRRRKQEKE